MLVLVITCNTGLQGNRK